MRSRGPGRSSSSESVPGVLMPVVEISIGTLAGLNGCNANVPEGAWITGSGIERSPGHQPVRGQGNRLVGGNDDRAGRA